MKLKKRIAALLMAGAMVCSTFPVNVLAVENSNQNVGGLCQHHTEHNADCGYTEGIEGTPCAHEHTNDCYTEVTECVHEHTDECYPAESVSGNTVTPSEAEEAEPTECTHVCSEESGCVTRKLNCQHEHNEDCGYSPATEGTPCGYVCEICGAEGNAKTATPSNAEDVTVASVQAMIDALPNAEEITEDNAEEVKAQLDAIDEAKAQLSDEELDQLDFSLYTEAASALGGLANPMLTDSTKKISVRMNAKNGKFTDSVSDGVSTAYGTTHTLTVTPQTGRYVIAGYFAGTDYYKTNPAKYQYSNMTLDKISKADPQTGAVQYQFTATEVIPISNDPNYDYICLYFHCAKLPTLLWTLGNISGEATAPSTDGNTAAIPYVSQKELCGDPNEYTGYYSLADKKDRPYLDWQVISITDKEGNTAGGTVAFDNNHLTYTPTADEAGKTVTITIRPKLGYVEEANTPLSFEIEVKKPVVEQSEFNVTMVTDGYGNAVAMPNSAKEGEEIQLTAIPDRGHHFKEWQATSGNIMITNDKFTMPAGNVTVKAIFEANTYTVKLYANGGTIASGQDVTSYTYGVGATLPTDITKDNYVFAGWYKDDRFSGSSVTRISDTDIDNQVFYAKWLSTNAGITAVSVNEKAGIIDGTTITVVLNYGTSTLPTDNSAVSITTADGATVSSLTTTDGSEWKFTVTAEDEKTTEDYTIKVSIAPDPATGNRNDVNAAKSTIENHDWTVPQTTANTEKEVKAWIEGQLANMDLDDASYTVTMTGGSFAAASEGDAADRDGTDGSFAFTVKLSKGTNTGNVATSTYAETTVTISDGTITATPYTKWTITVKAGNGGTVNGGGTFDGNTKITVTATPNSGYHFARWTENGAEVSISASYSFTLTADRTLTAVFGRNSSSGGSSSSGGGSSSGSGSSSDNGDSSGSTVVESPDQTKPEIPTTSQTKPATPDKNGNTSIDGNAVQDAINKATADARKNGNTANGIAVTVPNQNAADAKKLSITIKAQTLDKLVTAKVRRFEITTNGLPSFGFTLDTLKMLNAQSKGGDLILRISEAAVTSAESKAAIGTRPVYEVSLVYVTGGKEVPLTDWQGKTVSVKLPYTPAANEQAGNLYAVYVNDKGKVQWLTKSSYDADQKAVIFEAQHFGIYGVGYKSPVPNFTDINGHWAKEHILFTVSRGLFSGTSETTFSPNTTLTRGMFVTALGRLAGINPVDYQTRKFTDVKADAYYAPYVNWAAKTGIADGTTSTTFAPDSNITREQMAVIMKNYADKMGYSIPKTLEAVTFTDNAQISSWAKDAVKAMQQAGVLSGKENNRFDPQGNATRAEAATVLHRFVEVIIDPQTANGWVQNDSGEWSYYKNGDLVKGWLSNDQKWYWLDKNTGKMFSGGWKQIDGKQYYFYADGSMAVNTTVDGKTIGADGARK